MFLSDSLHTVDAKNRVVVPKRFLPALGRDAEGNTVAVLTRGQDGCLFLFSEEGFRRTTERLSTDAITGHDERRMQRLFFGRAHRLVLDASGRILIPETLKELAGIDREVVMLGVMERAEIWARDRFDAMEADSGKEFDRLDEVLGRRPEPESATGPGGDYTRN